MNRLTELLEELARLEERQSLDESEAMWQEDVQLFQLKLMHEEVVQLTRMNNYMGAYHDIAITHASELSQKLDALEVKLQGLEAVVDEQIMGVIHRIAEDVKQLPPEQTKEEKFFQAKKFFGLENPEGQKQATEGVILALTELATASGYEDTQRYDKKEDIK